MILCEKKIDSLETVNMYIDQIHYIIDHLGEIVLIKKRKSENNRPLLYTNLGTLNDLYPDDNIIEMIKIALYSLDAKDYLYTTTDRQRKNQPPLLVFGKKIKIQDVYIKIRIGILENRIKVLSFHYALYSINSKDYPYLE